MKRIIDRIALSILTIIVLIVFLLFMLINSGQAHDPNRPELNDWFMSLQSGKGPCCDGSDALRLDDAEWESRDGHYWVHIPGNLSAPLSSELVWVEVPDEAIVKEPNKAGPTMVWPMWKEGGLTVRCFMPGSMT